jgi:hypothetical protein
MELRNETDQTPIRTVFFEAVETGMPALVTSNLAGGPLRLSGSTRFRMLGPLLPMICPARIVITFFFAVAGSVRGVALRDTIAAVLPVVVLQ